MIRHIAAASVIAVSTGLLSSCSPPGEPREEPTAVSAENTKVPLTEKAAELVDQMMAKDFGAVVAEFDTTMTAAMPETLLATTITQLEGQAGAFRERTDIRQAQEAGYEVIYVTTIFEKVTLNTKVVFDEDGKVAGLFFLPR